MWQNPLSICLSQKSLSWYFLSVSISYDRFNLRSCQRFIIFLPQLIWWKYCMIAANQTQDLPQTLISRNCHEISFSLYHFTCATWDVNLLILTIFPCNINTLPTWSLTTSEFCRFQWTLILLVHIVQSSEHRRLVYRRVWDEFTPMHLFLCTAFVIFIVTLLLV